jgi:hypothetical protein
MISARARASLDRMVMHGLQHALPPVSGAPVVVEDADGVSPAAGSHMVVLMLASHTFRLVIVMYVCDDEATRSYLERVGRLTAGDASEQAFRDSISESGNMCCGAVNRELGKFYRHTGMSTPHIIDSRSAWYLDGMQHEHLRHFRVNVDGARFEASLCASAHRDMDFDWEPEPEPETSGELELF